MKLHDDSSSPIFQQIDDEHHQMRELVGNLHRMLDQRSDPAAAMQAMDAYVQYLHDHFQHEDDGGFFDGITNIAPRLSERANAVSHEHEQLLSSATVFRDTLRSTQSPSATWWDEFEQGFHRLAKALMQHERREQELLQEAFLDDIGTGD